jgi:hypothetical protein
MNNIFHIKCRELVKFFDKDTIELKAKCSICNKIFRVEEIQEQLSLGVDIDIILRPDVK